MSANEESVQSISLSTASSAHSHSLSREQSRTRDRGVSTLLTRVHIGLSLPHPCARPSTGLCAVHFSLMDHMNVPTHGLLLVRSIPLSRTFSPTISCLEDTNLDLTKTMTAKGPFGHDVNFKVQGAYFPSSKPGLVVLRANNISGYGAEQPIGPSNP